MVSFLYNSSSSLNSGLYSNVRGRPSRDRRFASGSRAAGPGSERGRCVFRPNLGLQRPVARGGTCGGVSLFLAKPGDIRRELVVSDRYTLSFQPISNGL